MLLYLKQTFLLFLCHLSIFWETRYTKVEFYHKYYNVLSVSDICYLNM